jgi:hypothetical protein
MLNFPGWFPFLHKDKARDAQVSFFLRQMTTRQKKSIGPKELAETIRSHLDLQKETPNAGKPGTSRFFKKFSIIFRTISRYFKPCRDKLRDAINTLCAWET